MPRSWRPSPALDPKILRPMAYRTVEQREALTLLRAADFSQQDGHLDEGGVRAFLRWRHRGTRLGCRHQREQQRALKQLPRRHESYGPIRNGTQLSESLALGGTPFHPALGFEWQEDRFRSATGSSPQQLR
jgi:hypothetical protein